MNDITEEEAIKEGIEFFLYDQETLYKDYYFDKQGGWRSPISSFLSLWGSTYGADSVNKNPWVWAVSFSEIKEDQGGAAFQNEGVTPLTCS